MNPKLAAAKAALRKKVAEERAQQFLTLCQREGLPTPFREHVFAKPRRWRFDYAWPTKLSPRSGAFGFGGVALEVEGGAWIQGRHTRGTGFLADLAKYNMATLRGWKLLRVTPQQLCSAETMVMLKTLLNVGD